MTLFQLVACALTLALIPFPVTESKVRFELLINNLSTNQIDVNDKNSKTCKRRGSHDSSESRKCPHAAVQRDSLPFLYFIPIVCYRFDWCYCFYVRVESQAEEADQSAVIILKVLLHPNESKST